MDLWLSSTRPGAAGLTRSIIDSIEKLKFFDLTVKNPG